MSLAAQSHHSQTRPQEAVSISYETVVSIVVFVFVFCSSISFIEPSPYDFLALLALGVWFAGNPRLHATTLPVLILWIFFAIIGFAALTPYWNEPVPVLWQFQSLFLFVTVIFFTIYFSEKTLARVTLGMNAYVCGALFAALAGIAGYLNIAGLGAFAVMYEGRASGTFKDPNALSAYLLMAISYLAAKIFLGNTRRPILTMLGFLILMAGMFLTFSRGSWGATVVLLSISVVFSFLAADTSRMRKRIVVMTAFCGGVATLALLAILLDPATQDLLQQRASVTQDYDVGETGRFGNQLRGIEMLLGLPQGFGPLRWRLVFDLDPHSSYVGAFANYGWAGGFLWLIICGTTCWIGFRLMLRPSPYRLISIGVFPGVLALLLQGFQIDVDHWRQLYIGFGLVWGLETGRRKWLAGNPDGGR